MGLSERVPTSEILDKLARDATSDEVTLGWIIGRLSERSFGIVMLLIGLVGLLPGVSTFAGVLLAIPAIQMMLGRDEPVLPARVAHRRFSTRRLGRLIARVTPTLRWIERAVRPRWNTPFETRKRVVGLIAFLLGATLLIPVPFSHLLPIAAIMLLAFAFLEEDGLILAIAIAVSLLSLAVSAAALWGVIEVGLLI
ncbi:exopolysaccharide biosynthesis protein [Rhodovibrio salinarum]|uniref:Exopolysaccharide biosynthesis protein n=1 Tax=Rhodovibrio salinarum TaxID=1087 RepID=A0A934QH50_9PROT|nr:exopolysaccharide biosynthesis protein [Rhodovibrio salinarum]MBK1696420.1 exopolysaccharide biosynthesis protein [Rhodovibrio salinarum]